MTIFFEDCKPEKKQNKQTDKNITECHDIKKSWIIDCTANSNRQT